MIKFAKLYETRLGQILVKQDDGENGAEVKIYFTPEKLGVCSVGLNWPKDDCETQWEKADSAFEKMTEESAVSMVSEVLEKMGVVK